MAPVEHAAEAPEHPGEVLDVLGDEVVRVAAHLEGVVLRVDAEGVKADGLENVLAAQPPIATVHIGASVGVDVADVQPLGGWIGEHHQVVVGVLGVAQVRIGHAVDAVPLPALAPLALHGFGVVAVLLVGHGLKVSQN